MHVAAITDPINFQQATIETISLTKRNRIDTHAGDLSVKRRRWRMTIPLTVPASDCRSATAIFTIAQKEKSDDYN
jgi:hypothetical protein